VKVCFFSLDGKRIISSSNDYTLKIWDVETGEELATIPGIIGRGLTIKRKEWLSPDGKYIVSALGQTLMLWDAKNGDKLATLTSQTGAIPAVTFSPDASYSVLASVHGLVLILSHENLEILEPIVTSARIRLYEGKKSNWDKNITAGCNWCVKRFTVPDNILDLIRSIYRNLGITPDQSSCLHLPDEAWEESGLISECPLCHKPLKFNPFIVDNSDK